MYLLYMGRDDADRIDGENDEDSQGEQAGQDPPISNELLREWPAMVSIL